MKLIDKILNVVYPIKCIECGKISEKHLCNKCKAKLGIKLETNVDEYKNKAFHKHIYLFKYNGWIREKIIKYKFRDKAYLYRFFAEIIIEVNNQNKFLENYDYIVPIPISKKRKQERGYNQSQLIAKELTKKINNISVAKLINKKTDNKAQSTLNQKERESNVKGVYEINEKEAEKYEEIINKNILLIDDIYTTGSTVNEVAMVLQNYGIKNVDVFTIAKD